MRTRAPWLTLLLALAACGGAPPTAPAHPDARPARPSPQSDGSDSTICVVDGKRVSFSDLQARLGELSVNPKPVSTATLEDPNGSFGGTEEHYAAIEKRTGHAYDYRIVRTSTTHHYSIARSNRPDGAPIAEPPRPEVVEHLTVDGHEVTKAAFEQALGDFDVDAEPWVNAHVEDSQGNSGTSASFEARHRKTGERWTLSFTSVGGRSSRALSRGSQKSRSARP